MENEKDIIQQIKQHPNNERIVFDKDKHTYHVDGKRFKGATGWIGKFCKPFNAKEIAEKLAKRYGREPQEFLDEWEETRQYGNFVHDSAENYINDGEDNDSIELETFKRFLEEHDLTPVLAEWVIFNEDFDRASAVDLPCINNKGEIVVIDLKTREKGIEFSSYQDAKMSFPLNSLPDSRYYKYCLQVNLYQDWIRRYGFKVSNTGYILNIYGDQYELIPTLDLSNEIENLYEFEKEHV